jgi:hypothetical protein
MDEMIDFLASIGVFIAEGVEDDTAVDVHIFAKRIVLEGITSVDDGCGHILLLLLGLFSEEGLVVLKVLQG